MLPFVVRGNVPRMYLDPSVTFVFVNKLMSDNTSARLFH